MAQENIGFELTILPPSAFKKPGNPSGLPGFFHATIHPKLPGQNCFAPLKQKLGLQSKEKRRRHPLWLSRRFDDAMRPNFCFRGNVFLRQRAFRPPLFHARAAPAGRVRRGPSHAALQAKAYAQRGVHLAHLFLAHAPGSFAQAVFIQRANLLQQHHAVARKPARARLYRNVGGQVCSYPVSR